MLLYLSKNTKIVDTTKNEQNNIVLNYLTLVNENKNYLIN